MLSRLLFERFLARRDILRLRVSANEVADVNFDEPPGGWRRWG